MMPGRHRPAAASGAFERELAAVQPGEVARQSQPQAQPTRGGLGLLERREEPQHVRLIDTAAVVDGADDQLIGSTFIMPLDDHVHLAVGLGKLHRVG
jgi:flavin-dependent dehydrogenase